jgi:hypothetical protein
MRWVDQDASDRDYARADAEAESRDDARELSAPRPVEGPPTAWSVAVPVDCGPDPF